ncbi:HK97 gp10 family phage protein [Sphingomonas sp. CFBP 13720]|uniref:HK97 gp10 family phage protein n=1 Tax=Sphingomonas sp. CFBP 13720 TaxID=2775302 RepID=UPI001785EFD0|nr:HK97 gp10 family phage protein [Sphingomonas sp. CFBP 13720]MBD8677929.1 HK97 gp10 family phage protein [Sphingomonas sp. CFBP 13720]
MVTVRGRTELKRFIADVPQLLQEKVLPGAARAAGKVIAEEAKARSQSQVVADAVEVKVRSDDGRVVARIGVAKGGPSKGWALSLGGWLEYGTDPHYITVDDSQRQGMSAARINLLKKRDGVLVINGKPVGKTVLHPGAQAHPFLRPALDTKEAEAVAAAQAYINARVGRRGIISQTEGDGE